jgi:hypothetical protein
MSELFRGCLGQQRVKKGAIEALLALASEMASAGLRLRCRWGSGESVGPRLALAPTFVQ